MKMVGLLEGVVFLLALTVCAASLHGQNHLSLAGQKEALSDARHDLVEKTERYRSGIEALLVFLREDVDQRSAKLAQVEDLFRQGYVSKAELEQARRRRDEAVQRRDEQGKELEAATQILLEAMAAEASMAANEEGTGTDVPTVLRFHGSRRWTLADTAEVANFFWKRFGRELPISAYGQTPTHDALGFDHHDRIDVAVNPGSQEGRALMAYLREHAISFIGFAAAVEGSATGAHIHLGPPSSRKN